MAQHINFFHQLHFKKIWLDRCGNSCSIPEKLTVYCLDISLQKLEMKVKKKSLGILPDIYNNNNYKINGDIQMSIVLVLTFWDNKMKDVK